LSGEITALEIGAVYLNTNRQYIFFVEQISLSAMSCHL